MGVLRNGLMQRLIVLGASNVTRSFGRLVHLAGDLLPGPLEVVAAHGHGRSYGAAWSTAFWRQLPGILHCGLWEAANRPAQVPTVAIVTDIGNDILYEYPVTVVADWVEECLDRLLCVAGKIVVTALPVQNLEGLSQVRYKFFRSLFVPGCGLSLGEVSARVVALNERVVALAAARGIRIVLPQRAWYGMDPLHVRRCRYRSAWRTVLEPFVASVENASFSREKRLESLWLETRRPAQVRRFGKTIDTRQPSARLRSGTIVSLY